MSKHRIAPKRPAYLSLPRPGRADAVALAALAEGLDPAAILRDLADRRKALAHEVGVIDAEIEAFEIWSVCGAHDESQDVEAYDGTLGFSTQFVADHEAPVAQLRWRQDAAASFKGSGNSGGNVAGKAWGTGGMIADDLFLTAGHCFNPQQEKGWTCPSRKGVTITPHEIAPLMQVNFKWQYEGHSQNLHPTDSFPVVELLECEWLDLDYAIVRIGRNGNNQLPNYGTLTVARQDVTTKGAILCIIQHGAKTPKRVATGRMTDNRAGIISYDTIDTYGGASGAPIFGESGSIVGVHTNGACAKAANYGQAIEAIRKVTKLIP